MAGVPLTRRSFLFLTAAATAAAARWRHHLAEGRLPTPARVDARVDSAPSVTETPVDLSVRWLHAEPRVRPEGPWSALVAGWLFDEGSGYSFGDVTGGGQTLFITGSAWNSTESGLPGAVHRAGFRGHAVALNGERWLAASPSQTLALDQNGMTITTWLLLTATPPDSATVISLGPNAIVSIGADRRALWTVTTNDGVAHVVRSAVALPTTWFHLAVAVRPSSGTMAMWVDGTQVASLVIPPMVIAQPGVITPELGRGVEGRLDQVTIHRGALTLAAVRSIRNQGLPRVLTQTSESIDVSSSVFTRFKGSEPIPHPVADDSVLSFRYAESLTAVQGDTPRNSVVAVFVPSHLGCGWSVTTEQAIYRSRLPGSDGTFEAWYEPLNDPADPQRQRSKVVFSAAAATGKAKLVLTTQSGAWAVTVTPPSGKAITVTAPAQRFLVQQLAHVAVSWGMFAGQSAVRLFVDGRPVASAAVPPGSTRYDGDLTVGGSRTAPAYVVFDDVRISDSALDWGDVCPRGQLATDAARLDLRDFFVLPTGTAPRWWTPIAGTRAWAIGTRAWQHPEQVGDDPSANLVVSQPDPTGLRALYHPDAYGYASAIEAGVSVESASDGWVGVFVLSSGPALAAFSGVAFLLNVAQNGLMIAWYRDGVIQDERHVAYDFTLRPQTIYEVTLCAPGSLGDGVYRGFIDHHNVLSMLPGQGAPVEGYAGLVTIGAAAAFSAVHFTALTPSSTQSRTVRVQEIPYGQSAFNASLDLMPFRWHKRRGLLPWQYASMTPEPAGNIAGADTDEPERPIASAYWRGEDSANSDLLVVDGTVWYVMRGNPRVNDAPLPARIGMLHTPATDFDALHFTDPNEDTGIIEGGGSLLTASPIQLPEGEVDLPNLNAPSTAYAGNRTVIFLGRESSFDGQPDAQETAFARFDLVTGHWETDQAQKVSWSDPVAGQPWLHSSPETVTLRRANSNTYHGVVFQQVGSPPNAAMGTAFYVNLDQDTPQLEANFKVKRSLQRENGNPIYGFRVMFDNGIYYLHYNEGPRVPDWPAYFVLATALDPYAGPWVRNEDTNRPDSSYFRRGTTHEPDNGAIWHGTMFKFRGHYYLYYENYHSIDRVDQQYYLYNDPQAGSRVGLATA